MIHYVCLSGVSVLWTIKLESVVNFHLQLLFCCQVTYVCLGIDLNKYKSCINSAMCYFLALSHHVYAVCSSHCILFSVFPASKPWFLIMYIPVFNIKLICRSPSSFCFWWWPVQHLFRYYFLINPNLIFCWSLRPLHSQCWVASLTPIKNLKNQGIP
jgi:hypothetical protein